MQQIITAKLKLKTTPEERQSLRQTQLAYRDALNYVSQYAFAHGKMSNAEHLQQGTYDDIRLLYKLPSQMACNVPRQVGATYKSLWTKLKKNIEHRKAGYTKKRYKGLDRRPCPTEAGSIPANASGRKLTTTPGSVNACKRKALAPRRGDRSRSAGERDG